jgi:hypothetical protein
VDLLRLRKQRTEFVTTPSSNPFATREREIHGRWNRAGRREPHHGGRGRLPVQTGGVGDGGGGGKEQGRRRTPCSAHLYCW